jgi:hypothetical protein
MVLYKKAPISSWLSRLLYQFRKHLNSRSRRIVFANLVCLVFFLLAIGFAHRQTPKLVITSDLDSDSQNVYYISKRTLCSRSIAYDQLGIQPIAVAKVILRPLVRTPPIEGYDDRLEVLEDAMVNDVVFLDRNVSGKDAELSAHVCPLHTVSILSAQKPTSYTAADILFGVTLSVDDIPRTLGHWKFWAPDSKAAFYVLLPNTDFNRVSEAQEMFKRALGIKMTVEVARETADPGKLTLILTEKMRKAATSKTKWFIMLSHGTLIMSMDDILLALDQYDAKQSLYLGALSESKGQRDQYGTLAYAGAGIVLSRPLAEAVAEHGICIFFYLLM